MVGLEVYGGRRIAAGLLLLVLAALAGLASHAANPNVHATPANDDLANASEILFQPYTNQQTTTGASTEGPETTTFTTCTGTFASAIIGHTIWYKWTAPSSTTILLDSIGSTADSALAVYSGPASSPTFGGLTLVGCSGQEFTSNDAGVSFSATVGTTYYFQVGGENANDGPTIINLGTVPATIGTTFVVDSAGDGGDATLGNGTCNATTGGCSLRAAVEQSNASGGPHFIRFAIAGGSPVTITTSTAISITSPMNIDGRTQSGFSIPPVIQLSGSAGDVFNVSTSAATIRGFAINGSAGNAISLGSSGNVVQGNYLGTNLAGSAASANNMGVSISSSSSNTIGGITEASRNLISGNTGPAINIQAGSGNLVMGNYIGTDVFGFAAIANGTASGRAAVQLKGTDTSTIGGTIAGSGNLISGNSRYGIGIFELGGGSPDPATGNVVQGNRIGTDVNASVGLANALGGIFIGGGTNSTVGGSGTAANTVAFNGGPGIAVSLDGEPTHTSASAAGNKLTNNSIHDNSGLGIDLIAAGATPDGVTANDTGDADTGPNNRQNFPLLTGVFASAAATAVKGSLNSTATTSFTIEYFSNTSCDGPVNGEGATFLASVTTTTDGSGNVSFTNTGLPVISVGTIVTATATRNSAPFDTSEFSACVTACSDNDVDQVCNSSDNCPNWSNSAQALPSWPVPVGDADCDGFPDSVAANNKAPESYIGTDPLQHCAADSTPNNEGTPDAMPPDFNDDRLINGQDTGKFGGPYGSYGHNVSDGPFGPPGNLVPGVRFDFSGNGLINGQDTGKYQFYFGLTCA